MAVDEQPVDSKEMAEEGHSISKVYNIICIVMLCRRLEFNRVHAINARVTVCVPCVFVFQPICTKKRTIEYLEGFTPPDIDCVKKVDGAVRYNASQPEVVWICKNGRWMHYR